jgi:NAD(P)H-dependent flavin oxidoreductase YrpB (nitropropane dioxygenase family)
MLSTRFTELVGCSVPLQLAGFAPPLLTAAVCEAGGFGMMGATGTPVEDLAKNLEEVRRRTVHSFGVNFLPNMRPVEPGCLELAASRARLVEFFFADPDPAFVKVVHAAGALACWQVGSREEAIAAEGAGCDVIVAQAIEAGGHVRGTIGLLPLLDQVLSAVSVPVLAAGGIGSGRAMAAALAAGADGVRVGTRFLAAAEFPTHPVYLDELLRAGPQDTVYTDRFAGGWRINAPHRVLRSSLEAADAFEGDVVADQLDQITGERSPIRRFRGDLAPTTGVTGHVEAMALWAGQSVGDVTSVQTAAAIVNELVTEAERLLGRWAGVDAPA